MSVTPVQSGASTELIVPQKPASLPCVTIRVMKFVAKLAFHDALHEGKQLTFRLVSELKVIAARIHALFLLLYAQIINSPQVAWIVDKVLCWFVYDKESLEKIAACKAELARKTPRPELYSENCHLLSHYAIRYLRHHLDHVFEMHLLNRPKWLDSIIWQKPDGTWSKTFSGCALTNFIANHEELVRRYIELNLLHMACRLADRLQQIQSLKRFALLDLLRESFVGAHAHLYNCEKNESRDVPIVNESNNAVLKEEFVHAASQAFLKVLLPQDGRELELPMGPKAASRAFGFLGDLLKKELLPALIHQGIDKALTPYVKSLLLYDGFDLLRLAIDVESHPVVPELGLNYPHQKAFEKSLHDTIVAFLKYIDPDAVPWLFATFTPRMLAKEGAEAMGEKLQTITLQTLMLQILEGLAPCLNEGGKWVDKDGQKHFQMSEFHFEMTHQDSLERELRHSGYTEEAQRRLHLLVHSIGKEPKGLIQRVQSVLGVNSALYQAPQAPRASGWLQGIFSIFVPGYHAASRQVAQASIEQTGLSDRIRKIMPIIHTKMQRPEHNQLYFVFAKSVLKLICPN